MKICIAFYLCFFCSFPIFFAPAPYIIQALGDMPPVEGAGAECPLLITKRQLEYLTLGGHPQRGAYRRAPGKYMALGWKIYFLKHINLVYFMCMIVDLSESLI
jgi:hypothetical protein